MIVVDKKTRGGKNIIKPNCVNDYNEYMKRVDMTNPYFSYCGIIRRVKKWSKRVVLFLFEKY